MTYGDLCLLFVKMTYREKARVNKEFKRAKEAFDYVSQDSAADHVCWRLGLGDYAMPKTDSDYDECMKALEAFESVK
jgi:hypothetical protein